MINEDIRHIIEPELNSGERLLWADKPWKIPFNGMALMMCLISGLFVLIGLLVLLPMAFISEGGGFIFVFVVIWTSIAGWNLYKGVNMLTGPFLNVYAITNHRLIIIDRLGSGRIATLSAPHLGSIVRSGNDRLGTLKFGAEESMFQFNMALKTSLNAFHNIQNPRDVESLIHKTFLTKD